MYNTTNTTNIFLNDLTEANIPRSRPNEIFGIERECQISKWMTSHAYNAKIDVVHCTCTVHTV